MDLRIIMESVRQIGPFDCYVRLDPYGLEVYYYRISKKYDNYEHRLYVENSI